MFQVKGKYLINISSHSDRKFNWHAIEKDSWTNNHLQSIYHYSEAIVSYDIVFLITDQKREIIFKHDFIMIARRRFMTNNLPKKGIWDWIALHEKSYT